MELSDIQKLNLLNNHKLSRIVDYGKLKELHKSLKIVPNDEPQVKDEVEKVEPLTVEPIRKPPKMKKVKK